MPVGIEKINLYTSRFYVDSLELACARGRNPREIAEQVMIESRAVVPSYEDAITLAVNAARPLLSPDDLQNVELLIVGTESALDYGKAASTWVHRYCELPANCRNFEIKHACYGGTAALQMAALWVSSDLRPGKKALVISTDLTRPSLTSGYDFVGGGCAVAMLISKDPQVLELELGKVGYWTHEISDIFRPTSRAETGDNQLSLYSYLDALEGAYGHYEQVAGEVNYETHFKKHIYHAPFPGMTLQAHRTLLGKFGIGKAAVRASFDEKVSAGLCFARRLGSAYGASNFVCLLGLLHSAEDLQAGEVISLFAYGSGCHGEFYSGVIGPSARDKVRALGLDKHLDDRVRLPIDRYESIEKSREAHTDCSDYEPGYDGLDEAYNDHYRNKGLLVLEQVKNYQRKYQWS